MDGKSKTSHISPTTLGQMIPVESANIDELQGVSQIGDDLRMVGDGDSIQAAVDAVGNQGWVIIRPDYDESVETFPVSISEPITLSGTGHHDIVAPDNSANVLEVDLAGANAPPGPTIQNLGIQNGLRGISVSDARYVKLDHVHVEDADFGIDLQQGPTANSVSCTVINCQLDGNVNAGLDTDSGTHATRVIGCLIQNNGGHGIDIDSVSSFSVANSTIQLNDGEGIDATGPEALFITGTYFEDNDANNNRDVLISESDSAVVEGCYFNGLNNNTFAVTLSTTANRSTVRSCFFRDYTGDAISIAGGADHDVYEHTHTLDGVSAFLDDSGTRTRDSGHVRVGGTAAVGKVFGGIVNGDHHDFASAQAAIDFANTNSLGSVVFPAGTFGAISIPDGMRVIGSTQIGGNVTEFSANVTAGGTVDLGQGASIAHCQVANTGANSGDVGVATAGNSCSIQHVRPVDAGGSGIEVDVNNAVVMQCTSQAGNISGNPLLLTSGSSQCIATNNRGFGTIVDNGTGNQVANNT